MKFPKKFQEISKKVHGRVARKKKNTLKSVAAAYQKNRDGCCTDCGKQKSCKLQSKVSPKILIAL
jgi:hypothetical protein